MDKPTLQLGSEGQAVRDWQALCGAPLDGDFGPITEKATKAFQAANGLPVDGVVNEATWLVAQTKRTDPPAPHADLIPFVQAKNYRIGRKTPISVIVIHTMENSEKPGTAMAVAKWFASAASPMASCHYCIDSDATVQCVKDSDTAFHAPGANSTGIGLEHAGRAAQGHAGWLDEFSQKMLKRSAKLTAGLCQKHGIPAVRLSPTELAAGGRGIVGHKDCTDAFKTKGGHVDPGPTFPWSQYIDMVKGHLDES